MRFSHFSVLALSSLSIASPVLSKRADAVSLLTDLYTTVQTYTGAISKSSYCLSALTLTISDATIAPLSASISPSRNTTATTQVVSQIDLITKAITATTNEIKALKLSSCKRSISPNVDLESDVIKSQLREKRQLLGSVGAILGLIIVEVFSTVTTVVTLLGLGGLLLALKPLAIALSLLILAVELVLNIVLTDVIALLDALLTALALGVSGL